MSLAAPTAPQASASEAIERLRQAVSQHDAELVLLFCQTLATLRPALEAGSGGLNAECRRILARCPGRRAILADLATSARCGEARPRRTVIRWERSHGDG